MTTLNQAHRQWASRPADERFTSLTELHTPIIADCLNYNLRFTRGVEDVKLLVSGQSDGVELRAATGPRYGRIWNADVVDALVERFGDGVSGHWRVPGIFGERITVDKGNTTLTRAIATCSCSSPMRTAASRSPIAATASRD